MRSLLSHHGNNGSGRLGVAGLPLHSWWCGQPDAASALDITSWGTSIGAGGMGQAYGARDTKLGRDVALKLLARAFAADPGATVAIHALRVYVLAGLNHPNIAAIYGVEDGALILELVEGPTLAELMRELSASTATRHSR